MYILAPLALACEVDDADGDEKQVVKVI